jgi:hypothetical protein
MARRELAPHPLADRRHRVCVTTAPPGWTTRPAGRFRGRRAMPRARRSGGYMSPAAVRDSSAVPLAPPTPSRPASTSPGASAALPAAASAQPAAPAPKPAASTGTRGRCRSRGRRPRARRPSARAEQPARASSRGPGLVWALARADLRPGSAPDARPRRRSSGPDSVLRPSHGVSWPCVTVPRPLRVRSGNQAVIVRREHAAPRSGVGARQLAELASPGCAAPRTCAASWSIGM